MLYIYTYILTNLLSTNIHGDKENEKKKPFQYSEITNLESLPGGKKKKIIGREKRKVQLRHTSWKKSRDMQSVGQKNKNHRKMLKLQNVLNTK